MDVKDNILWYGETQKSFLNSPREGNVRLNKENKFDCEVYLWPQF
jgi:hypothetical protein